MTSEDSNWNTSARRLKEHRVILLNIQITFYYLFIDRWESAIPIRMKSLLKWWSSAAKKDPLRSTTINRRISLVTSLTSPNSTFRATSQLHPSRLTVKKSQIETKTMLVKVLLLVNLDCSTTKACSSNSTHYLSYDLDTADGVSKQAEVPTFHYVTALRHNIFWGDNQELTTSQLRQVETKWKMIVSSSLLFWNPFFPQQICCREIYFWLLSLNNE